MKAQISSWCVTFFADAEVNSSTILRQIYDGALRLKKRVGSVGVVGNHTTEGVTPYLTILHCDQADAEAVLQEAGLSEQDFQFEYIQPVEFLKGMSAQNRKSRLRTLNC